MAKKAEKDRAPTLTEASAAAVASSIDEEYLKQVVSDLQKEVRKEQGRVQRAGQQHSIPTYNLYPAPSPKTKGDEIGVVLDKEFTVKDLASLGTLNLPDQLAWVAIKTYAEFEQFLKDRGVPAYISFCGDLTSKEGGYECAKLLINHCKKTKAMMPRWDCHCPVITKKEKIEFLLLGS